MQRERGTDLTIFSPRASGMAHHIGDAGDQPGLVAGLQRPDPPGLRSSTRTISSASASCRSRPASPPKNCIGELERCVNELGFVGCNLNPDPSGGHWTRPPLTDRYWYPLYEKMVELDVPAMVHVSSSCNPDLPRHRRALHQRRHHRLHAVHPGATCSRTSRRSSFIIPHGGGAVPYHWGRYRGLAQDMKRPPLDEHAAARTSSSTPASITSRASTCCTRSSRPTTSCSRSEMVGAVRGIDPATGHYYDDTKRYIDQVPGLSAADKHKIFEGNARKVYSRLAKRLASFNLTRRTPCRAALARRDVLKLGLPGSAGFGGHGGCRPGARADRDRQHRRRRRNCRRSAAMDHEGAGLLQEIRPRAQHHQRRRRLQADGRRDRRIAATSW